MYNLLPRVQLSLHGVDVLLKEVHQLPEGVRRPSERLDRVAQLVHLLLSRLAIPAPAHVRNPRVALLAMEVNEGWWEPINFIQILHSLFLLPSAVPRPIILEIATKVIISALVFNIF